MSYFRYQFTEIGGEYWLSGCSVLRTKAEVPFEEIGIEKPRPFYIDETRTFLYKRIPNPDFKARAEASLENLPYVLESAELAQGAEEKITVDDLARVIVDMNNGNPVDTAKIERVLKK